MEALVILLALLAGLVCKRFGYPPLPGYLFAGFLAHALGAGDVGVIAKIADIGIYLLLFTIGLKLNLRQLIAPQVWAVGVLELVIAVPLTTVVIVVSGILFPVMLVEDAIAAWTLALALGFSSTVLAVKVFEERGEANAFHAKITIGILVLQDIIAVVYLAAASGHPPSWWALALPLLFLARPLLLRLLEVAGHGELVLLFGFGVALGGAGLFELVDLKGGLGALFLGLLLSNTSKTAELYETLVGLKDLFLIGFFLQIGYYGLPHGFMWFVAGALSLLIVLRPIIYYLLFVAFGLRARTALLGGVSLFSYSEFGLVVASAAVANGVLNSEWLTTIALAVTMSFFIATPLNSRIHMLYSRYGTLLQKTEREHRLPEEVPADLGEAEVVILGMGRVGRGVYERMKHHFGGSIVGVDEDYRLVMANNDAGYHCVRADASDYDFWAHSGIQDRKLILVSLTNHEENLLVVEMAEKIGFTGHLAVVSRFPDERAELEALGCISFNLYGEAGHGFAEHVLNHMNVVSRDSWLTEE